MGSRHMVWVIHIWCGLSAYGVEYWHNLCCIDICSGVWAYGLGFRHMVWVTAFVV